MQSITNQEFKDLLNQQSNLSVVDVREIEEYAEENINNSLNLPLSELANSYSTLDKSKRHYIICKAGGRSLRACQYLDANGFDVVNVEGGMDEFSK